MLKALLSRVPFFRQRASALSHRDDQLKADSAERRKGWNQVIAEHQKPLERQAATSTSSTSGLRVRAQKRLIRPSRLGPAHRMSRPPLTCSVWPVMCRDS